MYLTCFGPWNSAGGRCLTFITKLKDIFEENKLGFDSKSRTLTHFVAFEEHYGRRVSRKTVAKSSSCWRCTHCNSPGLHEENQLRLSNSTHFRFYWTKKHFISEWYFAKNHEIGSLVVRKVKKSWDSRQNRTASLDQLGSRRAIASWIADLLVMFIAWTSQKASKWS